MSRPDSAIMQLPAKAPAKTPTTPTAREAKATHKAALAQARQPLTDAAAAAKASAAALKAAQKTHDANLKKLEKAQAAFDKGKARIDAQLARHTQAGAA